MRLIQVQPAANIQHLNKIYIQETHVLCISRSHKLGYASSFLILGGEEGEEGSVELTS